MKPTDRNSKLQLQRLGLPFLVALLSLLVVVPALADFLGPDRTVTTFVNRRKRCRYVATHDPPGPGVFINIFTVCPV
ncbi:MAG: hypothetical protein GTO14_12690 [Anaerolineales bacterium]|nr:hypothetical protein [Anaerolineales bacterium]